MIQTSGRRLSPVTPELLQLLNSWPQQLLTHVTESLQVSFCTQPLVREKVPTSLTERSNPPTHRVGSEIV